MRLVPGWPARRHAACRQMRPVQTDAAAARRRALRPQAQLVGGLQRLQRPCSLTHCRPAPSTAASWRRQRQERPVAAMQSALRWCGLPGKLAARRPAPLRTVSPWASLAHPSQTRTLYFPCLSTCCRLSRRMRRTPLPGHTPTASRPTGSLEPRRRRRPPSMQRASLAWPVRARARLRLRWSSSPASHGRSRPHQ